MTARPEYEANMFAADLLISDDEILELVNIYNYDAVSYTHLDVYKRQQHSS